MNKEGITKVIEEKVKKYVATKKYPRKFKKYTIIKVYPNYALYHDNKYNCNEVRHNTAIRLANKHIRRIKGGIKK